MRKSHIFRSAFVGSLMASAASVPALAQDGGLRIDEIIITAEKREANLQDTAIAITAFDNTTMDTLGISGAADIAAYTPSMSFTNFPNKISIRGVGRLTNALGTEPGVAIYRDGIYINEAASVSDNTFMTQGIQILRGPQILYGRNAIGGAAIITTKRPTEEFEGRARAIVGSDSFLSTSVALSGPLTDNLRVLGEYERHEGGGHYTNTESLNKLGGASQERFTAAFTLDISDNLSWWVNFEHNDWSEVPQTPGYNMSQWADTSPDNGPASGCAINFTTFGYDTLGAPGAFFCSPTFQSDWLTITPNAQLGQGENPQLKDPFTVSQNDPGTTDNIANSWTSHVTWNTENWEIKYIYGTLKYNWRTEGDTDGTANPDIRLVGGARQNEEFSQHEIIVASDLGGDIEFIFGAFLYDDENHQPLWGRNLSNPDLEHPFNIDFAGAFSPFPTPVESDMGRPGGRENPERYYYYRNADVQIDSWAMYGKADFYVNDQISISAGLRYTSDEKSAYEDSYAILDGQGVYANYFNNYVGPLISFDPWFFTDAAGTAPTTMAWGGDVTGQTHTATWDSLDWALVVDYKPNDDHMYYAKVTTGYKAGGFQLGAKTDDLATPDVDEAVVDAETLVAYEIGHKGTFMDGRFQSNSTVYWYDYEDFQAPLQFVNDLGLVGTTLVNADKAKQWGIEWDGQWLISEGWSLFSTYSFMDTEIVDMGQNVIDVNNVCSMNPAVPHELAALALWSDFPTSIAGCTPEDITGNNIDGNEMVKSPKNKFTLNSVHTWGFGDDADISFVVSYQYSGAQFSSIFNRPETEVDSHSRVDLRLTYERPDDGIRLIGYVRNVADENYVDHIDMGSWVYGNQLIGGGLAYRTFGVQLDVTF